MGLRDEVDGCPQGMCAHVTCSCGTKTCLPCQVNSQPANSVGPEASCPDGGILILVMQAVPNSRLAAGGYYCVPRRRDRLREWVQSGHIQIAASWFEAPMWDDPTVWPDIPV